MRIKVLTGIRISVNIDLLNRNTQTSARSNTMTNFTEIAKQNSFTSKITINTIRTLISWAYPQANADVYKGVKSQYCVAIPSHTKTFTNIRAAAEWLNKTLQSQEDFGIIEVKTVPSYGQYQKTKYIVEPA